jgi:hypothetical protein
VRLIRLVKLFKYAEQSKDKLGKNKDGQVIPEVTVDDDEEEEMLPESHVGTEMTEKVTKNTIVGVLLMLIAIPNLQANSADYTMNYSVMNLYNQRLAAARVWDAHGNLTADSEAEWPEDYNRTRKAWVQTQHYLLNADEKGYSTL